MGLQAIPFLEKGRRGIKLGVLVDHSQVMCVSLVIIQLAGFSHLEEEGSHDSS